MQSCSLGSNIPEKPWSVSRPSLSSTAAARLTDMPTTYDTNLPVVGGLDGPIYTPTPDAPHALPTPRQEEEQYIVQPRDSLIVIAQRYQVSLQAVIDANTLVNPDYLEVGQVLTIPKPELGGTGSAFKIIPDSELVFSPSTIDFDLVEFIKSHNGFLASYEEVVDDRMMTGVQIVERVAQDFSVNPRLLLAVLEYRSGWVTQTQPAPETIEHPILVAETWRKGLYLQLAYTANNLNRGFYLWRVGAVGYWLLGDGQIVPIDAHINAGTAGVQHLLAGMLSRSEWESAVSEQGLIQTYQSFFGYPFHRSVEPLVPDNLTQPIMQLPFEADKTWSFTGGPHGGWGDGSAWAALDFAPPGEPLGCVLSDAWVVAVAGGRVIRTGEGVVIQDLDLSESQPSDGVEQTGWVVLYMHLDSRDRVQPGTVLRAGDRIGHPSCEGGISTGTHVHLARKYNGEWIPADGRLPFELDGWISQGAGIEYDGYLRRDEQWVEAWEGNVDVNKISR